MALHLFPVVPARLVKLPCLFNDNTLRAAAPCRFLSNLRRDLGHDFGMYLTRSWARAPPAPALRLAIHEAVRLARLVGAAGGIRARILRPAAKTGGVDLDRTVGAHHGFSVRR